MIRVRIEEKASFHAVGRQVWISGQDNEQFASFWRESHKNGLVERLKAISSDPAANVTGSRIFGVSRVEADPAVRAFYFYIASECEHADGLDGFTLPRARWAIFSNDDATPDALIEAEMYAFTQWLPSSAYIHAEAPELEVYPERGGVEYWLPLAEKQPSTAL